ncbi:MAG: ribosome assembly RNA-binding protein YhbY [Deltaproteobacteria bacterium]|nr:ribosome assembly RNA-binding protein YhbY [Deltaproteobacteria bacterium]MBW2085574.1 ribosome assembly RNA-binding protein YhbY [Deltaproteobacteria bacterium]
MSMLKGSERKHLRGLAHNLKPIVMIGKSGLTESVLASIDQALDDHELIKVKFNAFKDQKKILSQEVTEKLKAEMVGLIGNVAIFYREHPDEDKRKISLKGKVFSEK